jgi:hypothetical protein
MANTLLPPLAITRKSLAILHQKLNFVGSINRTYDSSFANSGAKIGDSLRIRLPNEYRVRTGAALSSGADLDTVETSTTLQIATQRGVDVSFSSAELTLSMDDFADRILEPAMAVLAANIESDALSMTRNVYNVFDGDAAAISLAAMLGGRKILNDNLAPMDNNRTALLSTDHSAKLVDSLKSLFQDSSAIAKQYREGMMGRTAGFDFFENTLVADHQTGTAAKTTGYLTNDATAQTGSTLVVDTGTTSFLAGDIITIAGVFRVHPETKISTGLLQRFVVTANSGTSATSLEISPAIVATGPRQNVTNGAANDQAIVKVAAGANERVNSSMVYHRDAFAFATADLVMPKGVDFASREVYDGISLRIVRQYDINTDAMPCRIDVLYGFKTLRPQLACRIHADA